MTALGILVAAALGILVVAALGILAVIARHEAAADERERRALRRHADGRADELATWQRGRGLPTIQVNDILAEPQWETARRATRDAD